MDPRTIVTETKAKEAAETAQSKRLNIGYRRVCQCPPNHLNCLSAKEWIKSQLGVWQFFYEGRDIRDKDVHPAVYPIALATKVIKLFTHEGELVLDPFLGSGTTLVTAHDLNRNAIGFDINEKYINLSKQRLSQEQLFTNTRQIVVRDDARNISEYLEPGTVSLVLTSPPYANLLNRARFNKSRRGNLRQNKQYLRVEQYSQDQRDLGTLSIEQYTEEMRKIFSGILPLLRLKAHCVINVADMWWENQRVPIHIWIVQAMQQAGYELRNTIIWDRTNIVNNIGIFGWPSNYITMGTTFEYILDFWRPPIK
jgi:DNA modification methylase